MTAKLTQLRQDNAAARMKHPKEMPEPMAGRESLGLRYAPRTDGRRPSHVRVRCAIHAG
jgi:hypothetical protein